MTIKIWQSERREEECDHCGVTILAGDAIVYAGIPDETDSLITFCVGDCLDIAIGMLAGGCIV